MNSRGFKTEEGWLEESFWGTETENAKEEIKGRLVSFEFQIDFELERVCCRARRLTDDSLEKSTVFSQSFAKSQILLPVAPPLLCSVENPRILQPVSSYSLLTARFRW